MRQIALFAGMLMMQRMRRALQPYFLCSLKNFFNKWIILERPLGGAIGDSGLLKLEEHGWIDLGFRLAQRYLGNGLAIAAASAWVRAAFDDFHIDRLTALVHPENVASIRVLEKLRFREDRRSTIMGWTPSSSPSMPKRAREAELAAQTPPFSTKQSYSP